MDLTRRIPPIPRAFGACDKDKPKELRHTTLALEAFKRLKEVGLEAFQPRGLAISCRGSGPDGTTIYRLARTGNDRGELGQSAKTCTSDERDTASRKRAGWLQEQFWPRWAYEWQYEEESNSYPVQFIGTRRVGT